MRKTYLRKVTAGALAFGVLIGGASMASATTATGSFAATCDPANNGYSSDGYYHYHDDSSELVSVKNNDSGRTATVRIYNSLGIPLTAYNISNNSTKIWSSSVAMGHYRVEAKAAVAANCNGSLPGNGNFTFKYLISF